MNTQSQTRTAVEAALQGAIDAVDSLFISREIRPGEYMHFTADGMHERAIADALLPRLSATHLGRLIREHGRELIRAYR